MKDVPALFRALKNAGYVACLVGALVMISGRYAPGAPRWMVYAGVSGIVFGWGLLAYALFQRAAFLRAQAPRRETLSVKS